MFGSSYEADYTYSQVQLTSIQHSSGRGFYTEDHAENNANKKTVDAAFFHKGLGDSIVKFEENKNELNYSSYLYGLYRLKRYTQKTLFAAVLDRKAHNQAVLTIRAYDACISSGFFSTRENALKIQVVTNQQCYAGGGAAAYGMNVRRA